MGCSYSRFGYNVRIDRGDDAKAIDAFLALLGLLARARSVIATPEGERLWGVNGTDENGMSYAGSAIFVGPDERLWSFSSNPSIHDYDVAIALLDLAYNENL